MKILKWLQYSAKGADARREATKQTVKNFGGALPSATVLRGFLMGSALPVAGLLILPFAFAKERGNAPAIVTRYCSGCHGVDGNSQLPYMPRLAGMDAPYMERKLASFRSAASSPVDEAIQPLVHLGRAGTGSRFDASAKTHMVGVANAVSENDMKAAVQWYASRSPAPAKGGGKAKRVEEGKSLFLSGMESQRLPACQKCHGADARGTDTAPRLAGQHAAYVLGQLSHFRAHGASDPRMTEIANCLENDQARAVAEYLQSL